MKKATKKQPSALRDTRRAAKLSQEQLAENVGCHANTIFLIESGRDGISLTLARKIAKALNTSIDNIFP